MPDQHSLNCQGHEKQENREPVTAMRSLRSLDN